MNKTIYLFLFFFVMGSFSNFSVNAAEEPAAIGTSQAENHLHLITFKCKPDKQDGPESTPQSPPLDVDDPGTPGCNQWEINVVTDGDLSRQQNNWELPLLDINYGIGDNLQLKYEIPFVSQQATEANAAAIGEAKAGIKFMFYQDEEADRQMAVYPQLSLSSPDATATRKNIATDGRIITLPVLFTQKIGQTAHGDVNITANLGMNLSSKAETANYISSAVGIGVAIHPRFALMGEVSTEQAITTLDGIRQQMVKANLGVIGTITQNVLFFASTGHTLYTSDVDSHAFVLTGIRLLSNYSQD